jgi:hypothetical protein
MTKTLDVDAADRDAADASAAVDTAEQDLASGGQSVTVSGLHKLRDRFRHAELTARGAHERAERERAAARTAGLEEIGRQVDALAEETGSQLAEALQEVGDAVAKVRQIVTVHDASVADLIAAGRDLRAETRAPAGPRASSAYIAVAADSISHKLTTLHQVGGRLATVLKLAADGKPTEAVDKAHLVTQIAAPHRAAWYLRGPEGQIFTYSRQKLPDGWLGQLARGEMQRLNDREIDLYLRGEL